ncbi:MAG: hypothetical protein NVS2B17_11850 [Candidatus Velthaea sp.]
MNNFNWRALAPIGAVMVAVVVIVNVAFSFMWAHNMPSSYSNPSYGPGSMMGPWMWGGMGFFWIFPIVGFLFMLLFFGLIARMFVASSGPSAPRPQEPCRSCARSIEENWVACPYCGTGHPTRGELARPPSVGPESAL